MTDSPEIPPSRRPAPTAAGFPVPALPPDLDVQDYIRTLVSPFEDARGALLALIATARTSIYVADYALTLVELADALIAKAAAGVRVVVVLDHTQSAGTREHPLVQQLMEAAARTPLLSIVISTSPHKGAIMHLKVVIVDGYLCVDGSFNFSTGAENEANDLNIIPSVKRAALFTGRIVQIHDWALVHEPQYQVIGPEATISAATDPPEVATGTVERVPS